MMNAKIQPMKPESQDPIVGKIYVRSWGYDQTNVNAFQVVRATPKMMWLRPIETRVLEGSDKGGMCCRVVPVKDSFVASCVSGKELRVRRVESIPVGFSSNKGRRFYHLHRDGRSYYCSWYS